MRNPISWMVSPARRRAWLHGGLAIVAALAAGILAWGVLAEQIGETLFNATLV